MRSAIKIVASVVLVLYLTYRVFTTFLIMPLVVEPQSLGEFYFVAIFVFALVIAALSFRASSSVVVSLAGLFASIAFLYWWVIVCRRAAPIWSDFCWLVVPEVCFAVAVVGRSLVSREPRS
jgi:hypothetical protein